MKQLLALSFLVAALSLCMLGCSTTGAADSGTGEDLSQVIHHTGENCICGSPAADLRGCYCEHCLLHGGNPANPDCTCLPLAPRPSDASKTAVSIGGSGPESGGLVGMDTLVLSRGGRVDGRVVADDGESVLFETRDGRERRYTYGELNTRSIYKLLLAKTSKDDAEAEFRLATFAGDIGLYAHCRRHYGFAVTADPSLRPKVDAALAQLDGLIAAGELEVAREAIDEGQDEEAAESLRTILTEYPDEALAHDAAILMEGVESRRRVKARESGLRAYDERVANAIGPVQRRLETAREKNSAGLTARSNSTSIRSFKSAASEGERARSEAKRARSRNDESSILEALAILEQQADDLLVDVHLNLSSTYFTRNDFSNALRSANQALAIAPDNERAQQMRARIETAANSYWTNESSSGTYGTVGLYAYGYRRGRILRARPGAGIRIGYGSLR